jgi:hypothetical protein
MCCLFAYKRMPIFITVWNVDCIIITHGHYCFEDFAYCLILFRLMAGSTAFAAILFSAESGSAQFRSAYFTFIFRRIYDPIYEDGEWKIRTNRELEELNKRENIVKWIKG